MLQSAWSQHLWHGMHKNNLQGQPCTHKDHFAHHKQPASCLKRKRNRNNDLITEKKERIYVYDKAVKSLTHTASKRSHLCILCVYLGDVSNSPAEDVNRHIIAICVLPISSFIAGSLNLRLTVS
ncbi:hypothetical protein FOCC_FOCC002039 [Frankliniella occidentalis]|nr:hypothetical protein FOCC_FOCC002039 [Frankliniella occidentalis]